MRFSFGPPFGEFRASLHIVRQGLTNKLSSFIIIAILCETQVHAPGMNLDLGYRSSPTTHFPGLTPTLSPTYRPVHRPTDRFSDLLQTSDLPTYSPNYRPIHRPLYKFTGPSSQPTNRFPTCRPIHRPTHRTTDRFADSLTDSPTH